MRYRINTDKLINRLVPHFLGGRKYILLLQSMAYPLQRLNDWFVGFAREKEIEANITSQVMYFEWYLTRKFNKYFVNSTDTIFIRHTDPLGAALYHEDSQYSVPYTVWYEGEKVSVINPTQKPRALYHLSEEELISTVNFHVIVPRITIEEKEFVYLISHVVNMYRLAGKSYIIRVSYKEDSTSVEG